MQLDVLIRGARVVDGSGNPWRYGDVAIAGDRIVEVAPPGRIGADAAEEAVDATGLVVCPGFIDIQSHSIVPLMRDGRCLSKITQGVTTEIMGEAWTPGPVGGRFTNPLANRTQAWPLDEWVERARDWTRFGDWLRALVERGVSPNVGSFLGGGTLRQFAKGMDMGPADAAEMATMQRVMAEAMEDGAFGVSYALIYPPEAFVGTDEIVAVCTVVAQYGGVYITHLRSEADTFLAALDEAVEIGTRSGAAVEVYHLKAAGQRNWPKMPEAIRRIDAARAAGLDITADMYPYPAAGTGLTSVMPPWVAEGGRLFDNLRDPAIRERVRAEMLEPSGDWEALASLAGPEGVMPVGFQREEHRRYAGMRLTEIAAERGQHWTDTVFDLLLAEGQRISTVYFMMDEENLKLQLAQPWNKISTDAGGLDPHWAAGLGPTHPRAYGTYPRVLGTYVREEGVLALEDAVRKMTSAVADRLGLRERGLLRPGHYADVVLFDPATIRDNATFTDPHRLSTGIRDVWVNGSRVVRNGAHTGAMPGRRV
jgi:N-acyl-D-amino-acid deacylase